MGVPTEALQPFAIGAPLLAGVAESRGIQAQARATAQAAQRNARLVQLEASLEATRRREVGRREISRQRANLAARGIEASGSPLDLIALQAADIERDALNAQISARNTARLDRARAASAREAAAIRGRASLLLGASRAAATGASFLPRRGR